MRPDPTWGDNDADLTTAGEPENDPGLIRLVLVEPSSIHGAAVGEREGEPNADGDESGPPVARSRHHYPATSSGSFPDCHVTIRHVPFWFS